MSLKDAVHLALDKNKSVEASAAARKAAESRSRGGTRRQLAEGQLFRIVDA